MWTATSQPMWKLIFLVPRQKLKQNYQLLKLRPETDFDRVLLEDIGFSKKETVKETETEKGKQPR